LASYAFASQAKDTGPLNGLGFSILPDI